MQETNKTPIPLDKLAAPARRALDGAGYSTLEQLAQVSETSIKELHGIGPNALKIIQETLTEHGLSFASDQ